MPVPFLNALQRRTDNYARTDDMTDYESILRKNLEDSLYVHGRLISETLPQIAKAADMLVATYCHGGKAIFIGNGGSAADAQHLAAEFVGRFLQERRPLPALALNTNSSAVTAIGNDYGYDQVFARQLEALGTTNDVVVAISTSGNSASVIAALLVARERGIRTVGLSGASGGNMRALVDVLVAVPSVETPRIQECHILIGHALCDVVERVIVSEESIAVRDT